MIRSPSSAVKSAPRSQDWITWIVQATYQYVPMLLADHTCSSLQLIRGILGDAFSPVSSFRVFTRTVQVFLRTA